MKRKTRILIAVVCLALVSVYFLPVWDISLEAPQYPEGLGFQIWLNRISGDLNTVNGLNHYIGMKKIEPASIPELKLMPYILGILILGGLLTAAAGKKKNFYIWILFFILLGIAGGVDFWKWEYDYGHELDPSAAIKIPGMTYQPPLLGSKELLNFTAHSYPAEGGIILILGGVLSLILGIYEYASNKNKKT